MHADLLHDIGLSVVAATVMAFVARLLRQPLILAYIAAGMIIGPYGVKWVPDPDSVSQISELGLAFLLFIVGLEIDLKALIRSGRVSAIAGTVQVTLCGVFGWAAAHLLGFDPLPALYLGVCSAFSSTMIVVKLLSDKGQLDTVAGRVTLGVLLMQDVLAIVVLAIQPNLSDPAVAPLLLSLVKGVALVGGTMALSRWVLPPLFRMVAATPEVLLIASITWCFLVSYAAVAADFSIAMGALIAGVSMSTFPYTLDVVAKIRSLRDFFVTLFFVALGMQISLGSKHVLVSAGVLSVVVLLSRFIPLILSMKLLGYGYRVGILSSLSLAQVSEFSLIIVSLGLSLKHIDENIVTIVAIALVITSTVSTYFIKFDHVIARWVLTFFARLGARIGLDKDGDAAAHGAHEIVLLGCHRIGRSLLPMLLEEKRDVLVVDFSPEVHRELKARGIPVAYGDLSHTDTLEHAGVEHAKVIISTVSDDFLRSTSNLKLLQYLKKVAPAATVIVCAEDTPGAQAMYAAGADYVLLPRMIVASDTRRILAAIDTGDLSDLRAREQISLTRLTELLP